MTHARLYINCNLTTMTPGSQAYGLLENGAIVSYAGRIEWVGNSESIPEKYHQLEPEDLENRLVTPCLIDCHTHLVFGGNRAKEFEQRLNGVSYEEISRRGGGIQSTVKATRCASTESLLESSLIRVDCLIKEGVGVVEIKSGYGLNIDDELRMLEVARLLGQQRRVNVLTTWLAAHAVPEEFRGRADEYIDQIAIPGLRLAHERGLVDAVDGFCETIGFSTEQIERVFKVAKSLGLPVKLHAEQLSDQKGAVLAAEYGALSADHLEYLCSEDVSHLAQSGTVAVLLPGAFYTLKESQLPPVNALREASVDIAVATDCNPGSSPMSSILMAMNLACIKFGLTPEEALIGVTRSAAKALGLQKKYGQIKENYSADLAVWNVDHPAELAYWLGASPLEKRIL